MKRAITGFNQDVYGDWVAELICGHAQHVRHKPPWQDRPWVMTKEGREKMMGVELECRICDREEEGDK